MNFSLVSEIGATFPDMGTSLGFLLKQKREGFWFNNMIGFTVSICGLPHSGLCATRLSTYLQVICGSHRDWEARLSGENQA